MNQIKPYINRHCSLGQIFQYLKQKTNEIVKIRILLADITSKLLKRLQIKGVSDQCQQQERSKNKKEGSQ